MNALRQLTGRDPVLPDFDEAAKLVHEAYDLKSHG